MANDTPESDYSIECFQNYTAPEVFVQGLAGMVDQNDVEALIRAQKNMLQRFEKTTEMLTNCNQLSASRLITAGAEFKKHTQTLLDMKNDLNYIFKKIRAIKLKLSTQYPEAYQAALEASKANQTLNEEEDETEEAKPSEVLPKPESKMVTTISTETLKPSTSQDKGKRISKKRLDDNGNSGKNEGKTKISSSSETESASSGDDCSSDTG